MSEGEGVSVVGVAVGPNGEELMAMGQARFLFPLTPRGTPPTAATLVRWAMYGMSVNGRVVRLESIPTAKTRWTTRESVQRFVTELAKATAGAAKPTKPSRRRKRRSGPEAAVA